MKALQVDKGEVYVIDLRQPNLKENEVLIKLSYAGICRTDIAVMNGTLGKETIIPGHEFSGYIEQGNKRFKKGTAVAVNPIQPCLNCEECKQDLKQLCQYSQMLGLDLNGAFSEYVKVRDDLVYEIPRNVTMQAAAFIEPIAASLAIFNTAIARTEKGAILGESRIAHLMSDIMKHKNYENIDWPVVETKQYDYLIETQADDRTMELAIRLLKPRGRLIIKSRNFKPTSMIFAKLIAKEIQCIAVNYGSFSEALTLLKEGLEVEKLFGNVFSFENYKEAIENAVNQETTKVFLCVE
jgi:L-iditol 2-dehydrogenase